MNHCKCAKITSYEITQTDDKDRARDERDGNKRRDDFSARHLFPRLFGSSSGHKQIDVWLRKLLAHQNCHAPFHTTQTASRKFVMAWAAIASP